MIRKESISLLFILYHCSVNAKRNLFIVTTKYLITFSVNLPLREKAFLLAPETPIVSNTSLFSTTITIADIKINMCIYFIFFLRSICIFNIKIRIAIHNILPPKKLPIHDLLPKRFIFLFILFTIPATALKDSNQKFKFFEQYNVKEYWIIDPINKTIEIYGHANGYFSKRDVFGKDDMLQSIAFPDFSLDLAMILEIFKNSHFCSGYFLYTTMDIMRIF